MMSTTGNHPPPPTPQANEAQRSDSPPRGPWKDEAPPDPLGPIKADVLEHLQGVEGTLYGLFDAARDPRILELIHEHAAIADLPEDRRVPPPPDRTHECECISLYIGRIREQMAHVGPWLVRLPKGCPLLPALVNEGWGKAWGYYLTSDRTLYELRKHFRRFLLVTIPDGRIVWFRFADPSVAAIAFDCFEDRQRRELLEPVRCAFVESREPGCITCVSSDGSDLIELDGEFS